MSLQNSYLSQAKYGYDTVVAVSQKALNNIIKHYYSNVASSTTPFTSQTVYFSYDSTNPTKPAPLSWPATAPDPFDVSSWNGIGILPANVSALLLNNLWFAFQFTPGDPKRVTNFNYLTINPGTQSVDYSLLCTSLSIVFWDTDTNQWVNVSQGTGANFNINATIQLQNILDNNNLSQPVQAVVTNLGNTDVNVQQLLFDFDSAVIAPTSTTIPGPVKSGSTFTAMMQAFSNCYFAAYSAVEQPVLNYAITQANSSSLIPTSMEFYAGALVDSHGNPITTPVDNATADLSTLNYLFSVNGDALPAPAQFNWNWMEDNGVTPTPDTDPNADVNLYNGALSIGRNAFADYVHKQLIAYVNSNCYQPYIYSDGDLEFVIGLDAATYAAGGGVQPLNPSMVGSGPDNLLTYSYFGRANGTGMGTDTMSTIVSFMLTLDVQQPNANQACSQTLILTQQVAVYVTSTGNPNEGFTPSGNPPFTGYPISRTYTDYFTVGLDDQGNLTITIANSQSADNSTPNLPEYITDAMVMFKNYNTAANFKQVPVSMPQQFVFPGGDAFTFQDPGFSMYSDLVCHVTYKNED